ncbi:DASH family cryptochrome [Oscillatoria sp. FACHB-1406]|uniref:DASH family cryptochrome n=1 Tax=Oscillatoria sp. FACHB-1406 TaxID=2692846 RepID=UPI0016882987|nr:DASH family cryptochrome [Oscillatoria sp. FACHB-1406]MBD2578961.1 DASH family cryptochrome [Oscillatoria sp. FACHB-1406]
MSSSPILLWYRNTLRMRDREPLDLALRSKAPIFPVYCFDPRQFGQTDWGFPKTGAFRARFLLESVADLRESLQAVGSNLIVRYGKPEEEIPRLVREYKISCVYCDREITAEEVAVESALQRQLAALGVKMQTFWEASLLHPDDLPFSLAALPELFTNFRKQVEKNLTIREPYAAPERMPSLPPELNPGEIPTLESFGLEPSPHDSRAVFPFFGGETAGWARLTHYFWDSDCLQTYKETRNGMLGVDYSSKFSAWLANGSLSPRSIYQQVRAYEQERVKNDSTYWLIFELLWRDYFRFICAKHGSKVFHVEGLQGLTLPWKDDARLALLWREGKTGYPLVDANMRELAATGFMSNRGRQNVASFLTKNLGIDWRMGAEWFESLLIDYDVCSNYGNWNYVAGVGNDARGFRYFNIPKQSLDYDPQARYIKHWLPELAALPAHLAREPWKMDASEQQRYGVRLGVDYPRPVVDFQRSVRENEQRYQAAVKAN